MICKFYYFLIPFK